MLEFLLNLLIPIIVAVILIPLLYSVIRMILDIFGINIKILTIILFLVAYYFVGEIVLNILAEYIMKDTLNIIEWIYIPYKCLMALF
ncbi:MAG: hypothetical protein PHN54_00480 [Bacilli bacterium]|nr:hypothetical protein [Bacilli bacterium]